jgi:hypothetical protein
LHDAVAHVWDSKGAEFSVGLGYPDAFDRAGPVGVLFEFALELGEHFGELRFRFARGHAVQSGRARVADDRLGGGFQQVLAAQLSVESPCAPAFVFLCLAP